MILIIQQESKSLVLSTIIHFYPHVSVDKQFSKENENFLKYNFVIYERAEAQI